MISARSLFTGQIVAMCVSLGPCGTHLIWHLLCLSMVSDTLICLIQSSNNPGRQARLFSPFYREGTCGYRASGLPTQHTNSVETLPRVVLRVVSLTPSPGLLSQAPLSLQVALCTQVALGMEHLSNNRFVHKDLAARNCLVSAQRQVKVSALGLSKDVYNR